MDIRKTREELRKGKTIYDMPLRVAYYARVSTDKDDQLNSLENQKNYFEEQIRENKNWIFAGGFIDEGISGTAVKNRTQFLNMIEASTLGKIDMIITKEISRFSRNTADSIKYTQYLLKNGVIVYFLSDNLNTIQEDSEFRLTIMSSLAQDEVRKLSERVKFGINRMIKERKLIGGNLTGYYKKNGKYEINPKEEPIITYLFETYATGKVGLKKIGQDLAKMGYLNSKGDVYSQTTMAKFLTNPRYKGYYTARLTEVEDYKTHKKKKVDKEKQIIEKDDRIPAIVSEELWDKANALHEKRKKHPASHKLSSEEFIEKAKYTCLLYCKDCGSVFIRAGGSNRKCNPTWSCKKYKNDGVGACASPIIKESYLDKVFISIFSDFIDNKKIYLEQVLKEYQLILELQNNSTNVEDLKKQIDQINVQKDKLLDLTIKNIINDTEFQNRNDKFNKEIFELQQRINSLEESKTEVDKFNKKLNEIKQSLTKKLDIKNELPYLIKLLVERVEVEKINGDRKHIRLIIHFNFDSDIIDTDLDLYEKRTIPEKKEIVNMNNIANSFIQKCSFVDQKIRSGQQKNIINNSQNIEIQANDISKCSVCDRNESRVCCFRTKTWN